MIMAVAFVALPGAATACSSGKPSAAHAADAASRIVLARVVEAQGPRAYATGYHLAVIEYLKGTGDRDLRIDALVSSLCEDRIAASEGSRVVIAFDVESRGRTLAPYWVIEDDGSVPYGDGRVPDDYTLDDLRGAIEGALPDTATTGLSSEAIDPPPLLLVLTALLGALTWSRRGVRMTRRT
ncbi:MAG: hypothetical protein ACR2LP_00915 [Candidatus Limnocylindrales bacterium]